MGYFRGYSFMAAFAVLLSSCGFTEMPENMKETLKSMEKTNKLISDAEKGHQLEAAFLTVQNPNSVLTMRKSAVETIFKLGSEARIGGYFGMALPLSIETNVNKEFYFQEDGKVVTKTLNFPNVAIIQETNSSDTVPKYQVVAMPREAYNFIAFTTVDLLEKLYLQSLRSDLTPEEKEELNFMTQRMTLIAPALLGAITLQHLQNLKDGRNVPNYALDQHLRESWQKIAVERLYGLSRSLGLGPEFQAKQARYIRNKLLDYK